MMTPVCGTKSAVYNDYRAEIESGRLVRSLRVGCAIVAILSMAFIPLDYFVFRERFVPMLGFRLFCNLIMGGLIFWGARAHPLKSAIVGCLTTGAMLVMVIVAAGGVTSGYAPGLMLLFLGMPVLLPLTAWQAGFIVATLTAGLASLPVFTGNTAGMDAFFLHMIFPIAAGVESVAASALLDRMRFADFLRRKEVERARDDLKELDREKSRFTANIHHELRTPLTLMLAPVDGLVAGTFGEIGDLPRSYLETVQSNGQRLLKLINSLLDLAKIEGDRFEIHRRKLDLAGLVDNYVASARPHAERKGISISTDWAGEVEPIFADVDAMEKVIGNLLGNALKFTEQGGAIVVSGHQESNGELALCIRDNGIGIPVDKLDHVFDRFAQVDSSSTRRFGGTGIGLSLVSELVSLHGGRVWADSEGAGLGTEMHVVLPVGETDERDDEDLLIVDPQESGLMDDAGPTGNAGSAISGTAGRSLFLMEIERNLQRSEPESERDGSASTVSQEGAPRVLVVEDNNDMRRLLSFLLSSEYCVDSATNGREALEMIRCCPPDLVLTDVMMPEMSGTDLCREIKGREETRMIPVVLVTSKADREMKIQGLEMGADDYVTKPFHPEELLARVRALVRVRSLQVEVSNKNMKLESINEELRGALSELKNAESALVHAERLSAVGEMAAGVAHEVNNPVNFASNALRTLRDYVSEVTTVVAKVGEFDSNDSDRLRSQLLEFETLKEKLDFEDTAAALDELVEIVTEGLGRTQRLVGDLQSFASPGGGSLGLVNLSSGIASTIQLVRFAAKEKGVSLHVDIGSDVPAVWGNPQALNQVFLNLVKNGIEAVQEGAGNVWVRVSSGSQKAIVEVSDDGPGISDDDMSRVFDPFFTTKVAGKGTGLGLSISKRVVGEHGGDVVVSRSESGGALFKVALPVHGAPNRGCDAPET
jgi:signal transduction histidine kinase